MTRQEAEAVLDDCMKVLFYRDARSLNKVGWELLLRAVFAAPRSWDLVADRAATGSRIAQQARRRRRRRRLASAERRIGSFRARPRSSALIVPNRDSPRSRYPSISIAPP
jgi:hypothetical protein